MRKPDFTSFWLLFAFVIGMISCQQERVVPFPDNPSGYESPDAAPFSMPAGSPISWEDIPVDSLPTKKTMRFRFDDLPSIPFSINEFRPVKAPPEEIPFNWEDLDKFPLAYDSLLPFQSVRKMLLPEPIVQKVGPLKNFHNSTSGILQLSEAEGLIGRGVTASIQDSNGTVWIATDKGLNRYNGDAFLRYEFVRSEFTGFLNYISDLEVDDQGRLIVGTYGKGLYRIDPESRLAEYFDLGFGFLRLSIDQDGILWAGSRFNGLFRIDLEKQELKKVSLDERTGTDQSFGAFVDSQNNVWFGIGNSALGIIDKARSQIRVLGSDQNLTIATPYNFVESDGKIWVSKFGRGAVAVLPEQQKILVLGANQGMHSGSRDVLVSSADETWFVGLDTLVYYHESSGMMKKIPKQNSNSSSSPGVGFVHSDGKVWIGTETEGILIVDPNSMFSEHFSTANGLASNDVWGIAEDSDQRIWLATYGGLNIYDPGKRTLSHLEVPADIGPNDQRGLSQLDEDYFFVGSVRGFLILDIRQGQLEAYRLKPSITNTTWRAVPYKENEILISSGSGVLRFNLETGGMLRLNESSGLSTSTVWDEFLDKEGRLWLSTDKGINLVDLDRELVHLIGPESGIANYNISTIIETGQGEIVVGGDQGISILSQDLKTVINVSDEHGLIPKGLYDLEWVDDKIHVGSENGLIVVYRPQDTGTSGWRFENFGGSDGYPYSDYNQSTAYFSSANQTWWGAAPILTINLRLPKLDTAAPDVLLTEVKIMDEGFGSLVQEGRLAQIAPDDSVWDVENQVLIPGEELRTYAANLYRSGITWSGFQPGTRIPNDLQLSYARNSFVFFFSNPEVMGRDKTVFRYVLEGHEDSWSEVTSETNSGVYYNVKPGNYTFKVATRGRNGIWSDPLAYSFTILYPWWQTWWAYILYTLALVGIIYTSVRVRSQLLEKENRILEEKVNHRTAQLRKTIDDLKDTQSQLVHSEKMASLGELTAGIAHEIQNPLNFVNNFSEVNTELVGELKDEIDKGNHDEAKEIADDIAENEKKIVYHGRRAEDIVRSMLQHSRGTEGKKEPVDINALCDEYLRLAYHGMRAKDKSFNVSMDTDLDPQVGKVDVVPQDIGRVLLNLITNAFHALSEQQEGSSNGYQPNLKIATQRLKEGIEIRIQDNGTGIPEDIQRKIFEPFFSTKGTGKGTGLGLSLSYEIITKGHEGTIEVQSKKGEGSEFRIQLPLKD